jgi:hypothetical protein
MPFERCLLVPDERTRAAHVSSRTTRSRAQTARFPAEHASTRLQNVLSFACLLARILDVPSRAQPRAASRPLTPLPRNLLQLQAIIDDGPAVCAMWRQRTHRERWHARFLTHDMSKKKNCCHLLLDL